MKNYRVTFWLKGRQMETRIGARNAEEAKRLAQAQYSGATNFNAVEER